MIKRQFLGGIRVDVRLFFYEPHENTIMRF